MSIQQIMKVSGLQKDIPLVWEYLTSKVAPFITVLFSGVQDSSCINSQEQTSSKQTVWDILADVKQPLSKKHVKALKLYTFQ